MPAAHAKNSFLTLIVWLTVIIGVVSRYCQSQAKCSAVYFWKEFRRQLTVSCDKNKLALDVADRAMTKYSHYGK